MGAVRHDPGTWYWLRDADTDFSRAPVLPDGLDPGGRRAFSHGLPRSSQRPQSGTPNVDFLHHDPHGICDGKQCSLQREGWIKPQRYQVTASWLEHGAFICVEPSLAVLGQIQVFEDEAAKNA